MAVLQNGSATDSSTLCFILQLSVNTDYLLIYKLAASQFGDILERCCFKNVKEILGR